MDSEKLLDFIKKNGLMLVAGAVGMGLLGIGIWMAISPEPPTVEISTAVGGEDGIDIPMLFVDVAGAVEKPGVYKLPGGSRIGDALVAAGGLSSGADRRWVSTTLNLAAEIKDGQKIYIPELSGNSDTQSTGKVGNESGQGGQIQGETLADKRLININKATVQELDTLWGIGEARAQTIIASRPYAGVEELLTKPKIPQNVYDRIKDQVSVY